MLDSRLITGLNPAGGFRASILQLEGILRQGWITARTLTEFRLFETYRSPQRQLEVFHQGHSKVGPGQSAHQYGLAADFVAWTKDGWSWSEHADWKYLHMVVLSTFPHLDNGIRWDPGHVQLKGWRMYRSGWNGPPE